MKIKLKAIDKIFLAYLLILLLICLTACKSKKISDTRVDSLVKETLIIKDSIKTRTIFEYETIYDTTRNVYTTHIKKLTIDETQNKALQSTKSVDVSKDIKTKVVEPKKGLNTFQMIAAVSVLTSIFFILGLIAILYLKNKFGV